MSQQDSNSDGNIRAQGRRKSNFPALTDIPSSATLDFVSESTNYKITIGDFQSALNVTGTIVQAGNATSTPILDTQGSVNNIRNLKNGPGVQASVNPENGVTLEHNFLQDPNGTAIFRNTTTLQPTFLSLAAGSGVSFALSGDQLTISASETPSLSKIVTVNQIADFPDPVNGVITLETDTIYLVGNNLTTSNRFVMRDGSVIVGVTPVSATFTYTGTATMFTAIDSEAELRTIRLNCASGQLFDVSETGADQTKTFTIDSCTIDSCATFGELDSLKHAIINDVRVISASQGLSFTGGVWDSITINRLCMTSSSASFVAVNLNSIVSDNIKLTELQIEGVSGATGISGVADGANLSANNLGNITNCVFLGGMDAEDGTLDPTHSIRWYVFGNNGLEDTRPAAFISVTGNALVTSITDSSTDGSNAVKLNAVWTVEDTSLFSADTTGRITYDGEEDFRASIEFNMAIAPATGTNRLLSAYIVINGTVQVSSGAQVYTPNNDFVTVSPKWDHTFENGDYVEIFVENGDNSNDIIGQRGTGRIS